MENKKEEEKEEKDEEKEEGEEWTKTGLSRPDDILSGLLFSVIR